LILSGCGGSGDGEATGPSWLDGLPRHGVTAAVGDEVWAVVPRPGSEAAVVGTYRIEAVAEADAVLADGLGRRFQGVPGALVHPVSAFPEGELAAGTVVLGDRWDARKVVGRVAGLGGGRIQVVYDWNGTTATGVMDSVILLPVAADSLVLRWVAYQPEPAAGAVWYKGLCFAESDDRVWISDDGGFVEVVARDAVKVLDDLGQGERTVGAAVAAYSWGHGYRSGVIEEVLQPGLRYAVKLEGGPTRAFFFEDLTTAL
jgi:hypothetical protein